MAIKYAKVWSYRTQISNAPGWAVHWCVSRKGYNMYGDDLHTLLRRARGWWPGVRFKWKT